MITESGSGEREREKKKNWRIDRRTRIDAMGQQNVHTRMRIELCLASGFNCLRYRQAAD